VLIVDLSDQLCILLAIAGRRTPTVIVVKCGTDTEALKDKKPGNRGKRDSQLILMNFFSRVTYNDRMTPLDYDLFRKIHVLMGVTPDFFEACLMVGARYDPLISRTATFTCSGTGGRRYQGLS